MKHRHHLSEVDTGLILHKICLLPATRMAYAKTDLSKTPHRGERTQNKSTIDVVLQKVNIPSVTVSRGGKNGLVDLAVSLGLVVVY